jgi:hypothetical protein
VAGTLTWTRITDPDEAASLLPAWLGGRMIGLHTTGDVLRITSIGALHQSPTGIVLCLTCCSTVAASLTA